MKKTLTTGAFLICATAAFAQTPSTMAPANTSSTMTSAVALTSLPADSVTVTNYYKQSVYDRNDNKIGQINDVLVNRDGTISALILDVGGFLGIGSKDVAVPFKAVAFTTKNNNKWYLVMNASKDSLKSAPGFKYDSTSTTWNQDNS